MNLSFQSMSDFEAIRIQSPMAPFSLTLQPMEFQSRDSSLRCQVAVVVTHPSGRFSYEASDVWLLTEQIDRFISELSDMTQGSRDRAKLRDMSQFLVLAVTQEACKASLSLRVFEPWPTGAEAKLDYATDVDPGFPAAILTQLRGYDRWWRRSSV